MENEKKDTDKILKSRRHFIKTNLGSALAGAIVLGLASSAEASGDCHINRAHIDNTNHADGGGHSDSWHNNQAHVDETGQHTNSFEHTDNTWDNHTNIGHTDNHSDYTDGIHSDQHDDTPSHSDITTEHTNYRRHINECN